MSRIQLTLCLVVLVAAVVQSNPLLLNLLGGGSGSELLDIKAKLPIVDINVGVGSEGIKFGLTANEDKDKVEDKVEDKVSADDDDEKPKDDSAKNVDAVEGAEDDSAMKGETNTDSQEKTKAAAKSDVDSTKNSDKSS